MPEEPLRIYHASAGTGKTFTLVENYLALLLESEHTFRHILAVTFTNKATAEMKDRIIRVLYGLSKAGLQEFEATGEVNEALAYLEKMPEPLRRDLPTVRRRALRALQLILYEYPAFSVQTIDSFFQRVLRGFARELDLPFAYDMEFDEDLVLEEITDMLLLQAGEDEALLGWLLRMMEDTGDDTGNWDIKALLLRQGKDIFTEAFKSLPKEVLEQLTSRSFLREYLGDLRQVIRSFEDQMKDLGRRGLEIFRTHGVEAGDFSFGENGVAGIFRKLADGSVIREGKPLFGARAQAALEDAGRWLPKKKQSDTALTALVSSRLHPLLHEISRYYEENAPDYYTARVIYKRLYTLGIMADLRQQLYRWMREKNRLLISETGSFLRGIIGENDIPFVYEKTGQYYSSYMIDEFQDTSRIQYEDLLPLLRNSMASGGSSLIVGDIKQSLYRWRNGDWEIMHRDIYRDLSLYPGVKRRLKTNYRSRKDVVRFNNTFFVAAGDELWKMYLEGLGGVFSGDEPLLGEQKEVLASIYNPGEVVQEVPQGAGGGYVSVRLVEGDEERSWREEALERTALLIDELTGREGWSPGAVMVLVRSNRDGREVVRYLLERQQHDPEAVRYPVVSQDSLYLAASPVVRFLVAFLRYVTDPADTLVFTTLWYWYERIRNMDGTFRLPSYHLRDIASVPPEERIWLFLPGSDRAWLQKLMVQPLPEVVREIVSHFGLQERREEVTFLHTFQNFLTDFVNREGSDAVAFLEWWDETGWQQSVQLPEEVDAVRVLTIHKAKGLGASVVIMPFADWEFEKKSGTNTGVLWCRPRTAPFNKASLVPVEYNRMLLRSRFAGDYMKERFSAHLDNLNLLYVAFTRARERLYAFVPAGKGKELSALLLNTLKGVSVEWDPEKKPDPSGEIYKKEEGLYEIGRPAPPAGEVASAGQDVQDFPAGTALQRLRIAGKGREYFLLEKGGYKERIDRGTLYHALLAEVVTEKDVERAVRKAVSAGLVGAGEKERLEEEIRGFLRQEKAAEWFSGRWQVKTEADVILPGGRTLRPDRVMIRDGEAIVVDYKFGEVEEDAYKRQVRRYMEVMKQMGYRKVTGIVWYVILNKMIQVDD